MRIVLIDRGEHYAEISNCLDLGEPSMDLYGDWARRASFLDLGRPSARAAEATCKSRIHAKYAPPALFEHGNRDVLYKGIRE